MNITFLIGNGFDINLGLDTRYTDFYPIYLSKGHDDIISSAIQDNYEKWSDLELALGQILTNVSQEQIADFLDAKAALEIDLADYLRAQEKRIDFLSPGIQEEFQRGVTGFYEEFSSKERNEFLKWKQNTASTISYQFISFNYTKTLDKIAASAIQRKTFGTHGAANRTYSDSISDILHIHGTLSGGMILALDNTDQIQNSALRNISGLTDYVIKPTMNDALGEGVTERARHIITASDYLCVYGMSLGQTDMMWWKYILSWLGSDSVKRLVLYVYEDATTNPSGGEKLRQQDKWRSEFFKAAQATPEQASKLRSQIIVVLRSKIFDFKNIKLLVSKKTIEPVTI